VSIGAIFGKRNKGRIENTINRAIELSGLAGKENSAGKNLSLFDKKKTMLAAALATKPKLLLIDELMEEGMDQSKAMVEVKPKAGRGVGAVEAPRGLLIHDYTYDAEGNETKLTGYIWDSETNDWVGNWGSVTVYDVIGNRIEYTWFEWDLKANEWINRAHSVFTYDANGNQIERIGFIWDSETNEWIYDSKSINYWSELTTSIPNNIIDHNYLIYPNPFTDYTTIELSDAFQTQRIELIDNNGRIVRTIDNVNSNPVTINRDNLPSGIYFIRIHSDHTYVEKVIIR